VVALLAAAVSAPSPAKKSVQLKQWVEGPIRYIAEKDETKIFKKLSSDADRAMFIERFWARRDPSPGSLANEYRQMFWERVQGANSLFLDSHKPGWMTDRGKIYVLYGPPTKIEDHHDIDTHSGATAGHGMIRWLYEGRPEARMDMDPVVIVPFVRQTTGEYRVSYDPKLSSVFFDALAVEEQWDRGTDRFLEIFGAPRATELSVMLDLGRMQEVPPQAQVLLERVETVESYATHAILVNVSRYAPPDGGVVTVVTADVSHVPSDTTPAVIARFRPRNAQEPERMLGEDTFRTATLPERRVAQSRLRLEPGTYDLTVLVADPNTAATGMHRASFDIPQPTDRLRLSDVVWADELTALEYASMASHDEPFVVGPFRVLPRLDETFRCGETLKLFYEVYGGEAPYDITYQIEGQELDGSWVELGPSATTVQQEAAQGWEVPTSTAWPSGAYRVRLDVEDAGQRLVATQVPFRLVSGEVGRNAAEPPAPGSAP
jgi:GWxTD domain-containing protein